MAFTADAVQRSDVSLEGAELVICAPKNMSMALKDAGLQKIVNQLFGKPVKIRVEASENDAAPKTTCVTEKTADEDGELRQRALSHPGVKRFQELFPGAQIRAVRNLNE